MGEASYKWCCHCHKTNCILTSYIQQTDFESRTTDWDSKKNKLDLCDGCLQKAKESFSEFRVYREPPMKGV